jgi:hypothetical protein
MRPSMTALGAAILLSSASLGFAAPQTHKDMQQSLEQQGYSQVQNFQDKGEVTSVQAMKDGQNWTLVLSPQGQIVRRESAPGGAKPNTPL